MEARVNISMKVVDDLTIRPRRNHILGICPVCGCRDANFNKEKLVWRCWHCPSSGRIIPEEGDDYEFKEVKTPIFDIPEIRKIYSSLADKFHKALFPDAVNYLKNRGLTEDTIDKFRLGFCSTDFHDEYSNSVAEDSGVIYQNYPVLSNRIVIPYLVNDEVTDLRGRILDTVFNYKKNTPTYLSLAGNHESRGATFLFNHDVVEKESTVIVTEGEFKAIAASQHGFPVVATPGIFAWNSDWSKLLKGKEVILAADTDKITGLRSPAYLMAKRLRKEIPQLKVAYLFKTSKQDKVDIDSLIASSGIKAFENAVKGAMNADRFLWLQERKGYGKR